MSSPSPTGADAGVVSPQLATRVATAPISWGVCEVPGWGLQLPVDRVLSEMADLGFTHTELGSAGWLPSEADALSTTLGRHDLNLLGAFVPLVLHRPDDADRARDEAAVAASLLAATDARYFITAPVTSPDWGPREPLDDTAWDHLFAMIGELEELCAAHGLVQVVHEHVGCVIETREEVDALLAGTEARIVLDTGHLCLGGYDPLVVARDRPDRVGLVHLKDTRRSVAARLDAGELSLMGAVQAGLFPPLGLGDLPLAEIVTAMEAAGYDGWYVIEQDCAITGGPPEPGSGPAHDVATSVSYLNRNIGALARQPA